MEELNKSFIEIAEGVDDNMFSKYINIENQNVASIRAELFQERTETFEEMIPLKEVLKNHTIFTEKNTKIALKRAICRMNLSEKEKEISYLIFSRENTIRDLIVSKSLDIDRIFEIQNNVASQISYYCYSEAEKWVLLDLVRCFSEDVINLSYTNFTLATKKGIAVEDIKKAVCIMVNTYKWLSKSKKEKLIFLLNNKDVYSQTEISFISDACAKIISDFEKKEKHLYSRLSKKLIRKKIIMSKDIAEYCEENHLEYEKMFEAFKRHNVTPLKRKKEFIVKKGNVK